ncbi:(2Fe-2S) ferredoxin domain-containing protein [Orenia marismortui]|uniref:Thioredoxin-like protein n=1 Tax=Orenia marismortui TaxID=46469 RepID=A0A4R8H7C1_9FIRM|nr:(2Fe-2S) ferredoxin domain-containing protein [Orenia marismortui]TDX51326.1 thioredoxin-like protein [Orenia marismortui]
MEEIIICVGSSCHIKGAYQIVQTLRRIIKEEELETEAKLGASFCQGRCTEGVIVKFDQEIVTNISPENIESIFKNKLKKGGIR